MPRVRSSLEELEYLPGLARYSLRSREPITSAIMAKISGTGMQKHTNNDAPAIMPNTNTVDELGKGCAGRMCGGMGEYGSMSDKG